MGLAPEGACLNTGICVLGVSFVKCSIGLTGGSKGWNRVLNSGE
jgi:hypothetical protein